MTYDPKHHHRRSIRLPGYDYTQPGAYFVTICVHDGEPLFGEVVDGIMRPNRVGCIVQACWSNLPRHYPHVVLDEFVVMPTHTHKIIVLAGDPDPAAPAPEDIPTGEQPHTPTRHGLPEIVRAFKSFSAKRINALRRSTGTPVWQRNYYEHIIRNDHALQAIRKYIRDNPLRWHLDRYNPAAIGPDPEAAAIWRMLDEL
jgi:REP element-mobilizing transposase RayT